MTTWPVVSIWGKRRTVSGHDLSDEEKKNGFELHLELESRYKNNVIKYTLGHLYFIGFLYLKQGYFRADSKIVKINSMCNHVDSDGVITRACQCADSDSELS